MSSKILYILMMMCAYCTKTTTQSRILGIMPTSFKSMNNYMTVLFTELANRGHELTLISAFPVKDSKKFERVIQADYYDILGLMPEGVDMGDIKYYVESQDMMWTVLMKYANLSINSKSVQDFIRVDHSKFDLVICEELNLQPYYMFAHKYNAPLILVHTFGHAHYLNSITGNPLELAYETHEYSKVFSKMNIWQKTNNALCALWDIIVGPYYFKNYDKIVEKVFSNLPKPLPKIEDIEKNASMVFVNSHFSIDSARPLVPNVLNIAGMHIKEPKPLPKDIQDIIDNAKHGVIYFSLGSIVKSAELPREKVEIFLKIFLELKQTILWKWEDDNLEGKPDNVVIRKWMPQNDILAHKNVKLFLTHGGLLSAQEAIYHGVPIVGMPAFVDHYKNMAKAELMGFGKEMLLETLNYKDTKATIETVLNNGTYRKNIKELSTRFKDMPNSAMDTAIYWIEYVIRHKGAHFLKTPAVWMSWYEYYLVDVSVLLLTLLILVSINVWIVVKLLCSLVKSFRNGNSVKNDHKRE